MADNLQKMSPADLAEHGKKMAVRMARHWENEFPIDELIELGAVLNELCRRSEPTVPPRKLVEALGALHGGNAKMAALRGFLKSEGGDFNMQLVLLVDSVQQRITLAIDEIEDTFSPLTPDES